MPITGEPAKQN